MANTVVKRAAVRLNRGTVRGSSAYLARIMGVRPLTVRAWTSDPSDKANYRGITRSARRLLATMLLLDAIGLLDDEFLAGVDLIARTLRDDGSQMELLLKKLDAVKTIELPQAEEDEEEE